jgi:hypothetical protein
MFIVWCTFASTYSLAIPLGMKQASSTIMAGDDHDKMKVGAMNMIEVKYDDMLEDQHQTLEAYIKDYPANCKRRLASCFGKTS